MKDVVYIRFTNHDPRGHKSQDSMTSHEVDGVYGYSLHLYNPYLSDNEIMEVAQRFAEKQMNDVHTWGYARQSQGEFVVFTGMYLGTGRDGIIVQAEEIIGWGQIEVNQ